MIFRVLSAVFILSCVFGRAILGDDDVEAKVEVKTVFMPPTCVRKVEKKDFVRYHYYGMLPDGTYFDSSHSRGHSYDTYVFNGWLIPGMDQALLGMCVNEHRIATIPPHLAYGERGSGSIPGNSDILFNYILLDVWNENDTAKVTITKEVEGCTRKLVASDYIRYHYHGTLMNGQKFHSSYDEEKTYNTYVGQGWLIKGMDQGLIGACIGEKRRIVIPSFLAYGEKGDGKSIPPSATVIFDVEVIDFHNPEDTVEVTILEEVPNCERKLVESDYIRYHYNGTFMDGTMFDSSYERNHTYNTYVGFKRLIPGVDRGIIGVCMGEKRRLIVPPHLGYGEPGIDGVIPPSAVLQFDIHVIDFHNPKDTVAEEVITEVTDDEARTIDEGDYVMYNYHLSLMDGTFIGSSEGGDWGVYLGQRQVPEGVEIALKGMKVGEKKKIIVPPHIGYGEFGKKDYVPGSAVLVYVLEPTSIKDGVPQYEIILWKKQIQAQEVPEVFKAADLNGDNSLDKKEISTFVEARAAAGDVILAPHMSADAVLEELVAAVESETSNEEDFIKFLRLNGAVSTEIKVEL